MTLEKGVLALIINLSSMHEKRVTLGDCYDDFDFIMYYSHENEEHSFETN
jgi:hypothetical protein